MRTQKIFFASVLILTAVFCFSNSVKAVTAEELTSQIQALQQQIVRLQAQLVQMQSQGTSTSSGANSNSSSTSNSGSAWCHDFNNDIRYGTNGSEVSALQSALQKENLLSATSTEISNSYFGDDTAYAIIAFQKKYATEILTPYGLRNGTGYAGATSRAKLNALYGCARSATGVSALGAATPIVKVVSPNGGEQLAQGSIQTISWTSTGFASNAKALISLFNSSGISVSTIISNLPDTGSYAWTVPVRTGNYKISVMVISSTGGRYSKALGLSDNTFSIVVPSSPVTSPNPPTPPVVRAVNLTSPKTGDVMFAGSMQTATWTSSGFSTSAKVSLNLLDISYNRTPVVSGINNTGSYSWTAPASAGSYKMSITISDGTNPSMTFTSNSFTVTAAPATALILDIKANGQDKDISVKQGDIINVTWNSQGALGCKGTGLYGAFTVDGSEWVNRTLPLSGSASVLIKSLSGGDGAALMMYCWAGSWPQDAQDGVNIVRDSVFISSVTPSIKIISPNGGETYILGTPITILWNDSTKAGSPGVWLLRSDKSSVGVIGQAAPTNDVSNKLLWDGKTVCQGFSGYVGTNCSTISAGTYIIRVLSNTGDANHYNLTDESDNYFTIAAAASCTPNWSCGAWGTCASGQQTRTCTDVNNCGTTVTRPALTQTCSAAPTVTVVSPNGTEKWQAGTRQVVRWNSANFPTSALVTINLLNTYGIVVRNIAISIANSGSYTWTVPSLPGTYKVGVMVAGIVSGAIKTATDVSDGTFSVTSSATGFTDAEDSQLASISDALSQIAQQLQALMNK